MSGLATAVDAHNALVAKHSADLRARGLAECDVAPVTGEITRHAEGWFSSLLDSGLLVGGTYWRPVVSADVIVSALRQVLPRDMGTGIKLANAIRFMNLGISERVPADGVTRPVLSDLTVTAAPGNGRG